MGLEIKEKDIVVPGEELAQGMDYLPGKGTYRDGDFVVANRLGLVTVDGRTLKILPMTGKYSPKKYDVVIGQISDILASGWFVDIDSPYEAVMNMKDGVAEYIERGADLSKYHKIGDYVVCKITNITSQKLVDVTMKGPGLHKLRAGRIITINTNKVPRVIGKQGSMVSMIKDATGCRITVGQNGVVWLSGEPDKEIIAVETIKYIEQHAHTSGLTDTVKDMLEKKTGVKIGDMKKNNGDEQEDVQEVQNE